MASATPYEDDIEELQNKLSSLTPELREIFLKTMARVYEEESWSLIDFLQQSRSEMTGIANDMVDEQEELRSASSLLTVRRQTSMQSSSSLGSTGGRSPRIPRSPLNGSRNFDAERRGQGHKSSEDEESLHEYNRDMAVDEYHEEAEEVIKHMKGVETALEKERAIQAARLKMKKEEKMARKKESETKATELISRANQITEMQTKDKERQEQKVKEKLASKREKQLKKAGKTAETSLSDENWAVSYDSTSGNLSANQNTPADVKSINPESPSTTEAKPRFPNPREKPSLSEVAS